MRICDKCYRVIKEEGSYEIVNGERIDNCGECIDVIRKKYSDAKDETDKMRIMKEYIECCNQREENLKELIDICKRKRK